MKVLQVTLFLILITISSFAQEIQETLDKKTQKKMQKMEKKMQEQEEIAEKKEYLISMINSQKFVLEANNISGRTGAQIPVVSTLNFLAVDSLKAVFQLGSTNGIGYNGVGGLTEECRISRYKIKEGKGNHSVTIYMQGRLSSYTVLLTVNYGTSSTARISGLSGGVINFHGRIVSLAESKVFKAMSIY